MKFWQEYKEFLKGFPLVMVKCMTLVFVFSTIAFSIVIYSAEMGKWLSEDDLNLRSKECLDNTTKAVFIEFYDKNGKFLRRDEDINTFCRVYLEKRYMK